MRASSQPGRTIERTVFVCLVGALAAVCSASEFRYLAIDSSLHADLSGVACHLRQAEHVGPVLQLDQPYEEGLKLLTTGGVVVDPLSGKWRLYYELMLEGFDRFGALAESEDGLSWTKPALNVSGTKYVDDSRNNYINVGQWQWVYTPSVFVDPLAEPDERYKMAFRFGHSLIGCTSADGINFQITGWVDHEEGNYRMDALNQVFWDRATGQYMACMRWWYDDAYRGVFLRRADHWGNEWEPREFTIDPRLAIGNEPTVPHVYCPGILSYRGQYIGMPSMYYQGEPGWSLYPVFSYSRDCVQWDFPNPYAPAIDLSAHGQNEMTFGIAVPSTSVVEREGMLWIYYSYFEEQHHEPRSSAVIHLARLRTDGFAAVEPPPGESGNWLTSVIRVPDEPSHLFVNAEVRGELSIELLEPETLEPLTGFSASDAVVMAPGDYLGAATAWLDAADLRPMAGREVAIRFLIDDASVYSFWFQPSVEPGAPRLRIEKTGAVAVLSWIDGDDEYELEKAAEDPYEPWEPFEVPVSQENGRSVAREFLEHEGRLYRLKKASAEP